MQVKTLQCVHKPNLVLSASSLRQRAAQHAVSSLQSFSAMISPAALCAQVYKRTSGLMLTTSQSPEIPRSWSDVAK